MALFINSDYIDYSHTLIHKYGINIFMCIKYNSGTSSLMCDNIVRGALNVVVSIFKDFPAALSNYTVISEIYIKSSERMAITFFKDLDLALDDFLIT